MTTANVKRHKRQKPKPPAQHQRDLQKVVELELPIRRRAAMMQGIREREREREKREKLKALEKEQPDADITRTRGNLASVPQPYNTTTKSVIAQMERDLKEPARKS